jgi:hypothetical protein
MVAASSNSSSTQSPSTIRTSKPKTISSPDPDPKAGIVPAEEECVIHLRLLAAFSKLRNTISERQDLFGPADPSESRAAEQRWTIFVAQAVVRFEAWISTLIADDLQSRLKVDTATDPEKMDELMSIPPLKWTEDMLPPLDVLMVLHSYMLNPHDFLQDCLRMGRISLWKPGFPFHLISKFLNQTTLLYEPPDSVRQKFEKRSSTIWSYTEPYETTKILCPGCPETISVAWKALYPKNASEMQKGSIFLPVDSDCPKCQCRITQDSVSKARLRKDLGILQKEGIVMPGTLLSKHGLIPTRNQDRPVAPDAALLNNLLLKGMAQELIDNIDRARLERRDLTLKSCAMNDSIISILTQGSLKEHITGIPEMEKAFPDLMKSARRMNAVYDRNTSPFSLDLVGAVLRQGVFIDKMQSFDWLHSPALKHTIIRAIRRYEGFFSVMQHHPNKIAVPTFDVDMIWHTHQLSPARYYEYSTQKCEGLFIDHDDKIVDNVLTNSFKWTCDEYELLTGKGYDICLCWSCALLDQHGLLTIPTPTPRSTTQNSPLSRIKQIFTKSRKTPIDPAHESDPINKAGTTVLNIQTTKFLADYDQAQHQNSTISKKDFFDNYIWHHPAYAPFPGDVGAD